MEGSRAHMERMEPDTVAILLIEACTHKAVVTAKGLDSFTPDHKLDGRNGFEEERTDMDCSNLMQRKVYTSWSTTTFLLCRISLTR